MLAALIAALATVFSTNNSSSYACSGGTGPYTVQFPFGATSDLTVTSTTVAGVVTTLTYTTDYTLNVVSTQSTATLTLTAGSKCPLNSTIKIARTTPLTQPTSLRTQGPYNPATHEAGWDRMTRQLQDVNSKIANPVSPSVVTNSTSVTARGSTTGQQLQDWFAVPVNAKAFGAVCNGVGDDAPGLAAAITSLGTNGGTVDARSCTSMKLGTSLTISKQGTKLLLPPGAVVLGTSQIIVAQGTHSVSIEGSSSFGSGSAGTTIATNITYSGTSAALVVGSSAGTTTGFKLKDVSVATNAGGAAAIGIQLNVAIDYTIENVRVTTNQTQWAFDFEGFTTYTGGTMIHPWVDGNNGEAFHFGKNGNANFIFAPHVSMGAISGTCFNFDGGGVTGGGNRIIGGDCENATTAMRFDFNSDNEIFGLRAESCTNVAVATANASQNWAFTSGTSAMTVTDAGANNVFTDNFWTQTNRNVWKMKNATDTSSSIILQAGSSAEQLVEIQLAGMAEFWRMQKLNDNSWRLTRNSTSVSRLRFDTAGTPHSYISGEGAGSVVINGVVNSGTGGLIIQSGGGAPATKMQIFGADGRIGFTGVTNANLGTPANGSVLYCTDCTIANPCAGGGTGAIAKRLNGVWVCN